MMTQQIGFSVLTAPLAAIDRRALSQAWYSALHLAKDHAPEAERVESATLPLPKSAKAARPASPVPRGSDASPVARRALAQRREYMHEPLVERRALRSALARKIESSFLHPCRSVQRATFTVDSTQSRVHVALRSSGNQLRLIAICPANARSAVARALEEARYALAERGIVLSAETEER